MRDMRPYIIITPEEKTVYLNLPHRAGEQFVPYQGSLGDEFLDKATGELFRGPQEGKEKAFLDDQRRHRVQRQTLVALFNIALVLIAVYVWVSVYSLYHFPDPGIPIPIEQCFEGWRKDEGWTQFCVEEGEEAACPKGYFCPTLQKGGE